MGDSAHRILLVDLAPLHVPTGTHPAQYVASEFFRTPDAVQYTGCVAEDAMIARSMFAGDRIGGRSIADFGQVTIINALEPTPVGSRFDAWLDPAQYVWQGTAIALQLVLDGDYAGRIPVFTGIIDDIDYQASSITFRLKSRGSLLSKPLHANRYGGTGGADGGDELKGKVVPRCFGRVANIEPAMVDNGTYLTQFHDGPAEALTAARDKGAPLTTPTDYTLDLANGRLQAVAQPEGRLTADLRGSTLSGAYSGKAADIMAFLAGEKGVIADAAAVAALNAAAPYELGRYFDDEIDVDAALDLFASDVGGYHGINLAGQFDCGVFGEPNATVALDLTQEDIARDSLKREALGAVCWRVAFNYRPNGVVQQPAELVPEPTLDQAERSLYGKQYQKTVIVEDATIKDRYPDAVELTIESAIWGDADALAEATRQFDYWKVPRSKYSMQVIGVDPLGLNINETVRLTHPRLNLAAGLPTSAIEINAFLLQRRLDLTTAG